MGAPLTAVTAALAAGAASLLLKAMHSTYDLALSHRLFFLVRRGLPCGCAVALCPVLQVFFFFGGIGLIAILFAIFFIPETKNVPIEEIEELVVHKHWFWRRVVAGTKAPVNALRSGSSLVQISRDAQGRSHLSMVDPQKAAQMGMMDVSPTGDAAAPRAYSSLMKERPDVQQFSSS
jgi:hypothetical protein